MDKVKIKLNSTQVVVGVELGKKANYDEVKVQLF